MSDNMQQDSEIQTVTLNATKITKDSATFYDVLDRSIADEATFNEVLTAVENTKSLIREIVTTGGVIFPSTSEVIATNIDLTELPQNWQDLVQSNGTHAFTVKVLRDTRIVANPDPLLKVVRESCIGKSSGTDVLFIAPGLYRQAGIEQDDRENRFVIELRWLGEVASKLLMDQSINLQDSLGRNIKTALVKQVIAELLEEA